MAGKVTHSRLLRKNNTHTEISFSHMIALLHVNLLLHIAFVEAFQICL